MDPLGITWRLLRDYLGSTWVPFRGPLGERLSWSLKSAFGPPTTESENLKNYVNFDLFLGSTMLSAVVNFEDQDNWYTTFNTLKYHFLQSVTFFRRMQPSVGSHYYDVQECLCAARS